MALVLTPLLVVALAVATYAWSLNRDLDENITHAALLPGQSATAPTSGTTSGAGSASGAASAQAGASASPSTAAPTVAADGTVRDGAGTVFTDTAGKAIVVPTSPADPQGAAVAQPSRPASAGDAKNLLVIGSDSRGADRGRSDVMILAHVSSDRSRVDLVHFPRDLWTTIPGQGQAKLNAAYEAGGAPRLVQTLQPMIGVPIDHVALVDFQGFTTLTDAIGGIDLAGQHMNGTQALAWVRERKSLPQGDISRGQRQMTFVKTVLAQSLTPANVLNPVRLSSLVDTATRSLTVDESFSAGEIRSLAVSMRSVRAGDIVEHTAPWSGVGWARGQSIVVPAPQQMAALRSALQRDAMASYTDTWSPTHGFSR